MEDKSAIAPGYNIIKEDAIAWLEKQGEQKIDNSNTMFNACINALRNVGHSHLADWLEKQSKDKPHGQRKECEFRLGAEWADEHTRKDLVEINKIYIWLSDFLDKCYIEDRSKAEEINADLVLKSFLKVAKGE